MKLFYSPASPYARKCRVVAIEKGMGDRVELINASPMANPADLLAANPLGKIPALLLPDGRAIFDSPVICHYLDSLSDTPRLIPSAPEARLDTLMREALGDGIMDAALPMVQEGRRPEAQRSPDWLERWAAAIRRSVAYANARVRPIGQPDVGDISLACALGYIDFRLPDFGWRTDAPALHAWYDQMLQRPSLADTIPA